MEKVIYITTPIFYTNGTPHLGHLHTCLLADFFTKSFRYFSYKAFFLTGTDEHGQKISNTAKNLNLTPQALVDKNSQIFKTFMEDFSIKYDYFIRTTQEAHKENVLKIWRILEAKGYLYEDTYRGLYAEKDECFYSLEETEINTKGERVAISSGNKVEEMEEECYFFRLSHFKEKLMDFYNHTNFTIPHQLQKELIGFTTNLKDLCVSRKISWGIPIPGTPSTIYVWIDALSNYLTGIGGVDNYDKTLWSNSLQIMGKDIIIFHGVYWPAILIALGIPTPKHLLVHGWWLAEQEKMSKSIGNVIDPYSIKEKDYLRYLCLKQDLIGHDGNFHKKHMINLINNELIGKILNLIYRVFALIVKKYGLEKEIILEDFTSREDVKILKEKCLKQLENFSPKNYINTIIEYSSLCNQYIDYHTIWKDCSLLHLNYLLPLIHQITELLEGVLVETTEKIKSLYIIKKSENKNIFTLCKLETFFTKMEEE